MTPAVKSTSEQLKNMLAEVEQIEKAVMRITEPGWEVKLIPSGFEIGGDSFPMRLLPDSVRTLLNDRFQDVVKNLAEELHSARRTKLRMISTLCDDETGVDHVES